MPVYIPSEAETAGIGAAILAGLGAGRFQKENLPQIRFSGVSMPSEKAKEENEHYMKFRALEQVLQSGYDS